MDSAVIEKQVSDFVARFQEEFHHFMNKREEREKLFDSWIETANQEAEEVRPYARLIVCSHIVKQALRSTSDEIARYMTVAIEDIEYAQNREFDPSGTRYTPILHVQHALQESFIAALVNTLSTDQVVIYLDAIIDTHQVETRFCYALNSMLYALRAYVKLQWYDYAISFGKGVMDIYKEHKSDYGYYHHDTEDTVEAITIEIYKAHDKLGIATKKMLDKLNEPKVDPQEEARLARGRERNRLMGLADECRIAGDMQGYYGYMSAAGDVGR